MTKVRAGWLIRRLERRSVPATAHSAELPIEPTTLAECVQACARHTAKLVGSLDRKRSELAESLRELLVTHAHAKGRPELLDAVLQAGTKALDCRSPDELRLALRISDAVLTERAQSRAGWRLRARVLDALGEDAAAIEAHERYVALCKNDDLGITSRVAGLRESARKLTELLRLLRRACPEADAFIAGSAGSPGSAAETADTELWAEGLARQEAGDWAGAEPRLVAALAVMVERGSPGPEVSAALSDFMDLYLHERGGALAGSRELRELIELYAAYRRLREQGPLADPTVGGTEVIGVGDFRNLIAGKSICLVANSQRVGESTMGAEIDSYDLVVRFNSFRIDPPATGRRTDIHATIHKHGFNWGRKVETRLVFGGLPQQWRQSVRQRLVPEAQRYVGDQSLRWPVRNLGQLDENAWSSIPTSGFNMLWLLDFLDVNPRIDLIGFDFYASGAYRLSGAMNLPITSVHGYLSEKEWVMDRAQDVTDMRISLR